MNILIESVIGNLLSKVGLLDSPKFDYTPPKGQEMFHIQRAIQQVSMSRSEYIRSLNHLRNYYIIDTILNSIVHDALLPASQKNIFTIVCEGDDALNNDLLDLQSKFDLDRLILRTAGDILAVGEHAFRVKYKQGEGLVEIFDNVNMTNFMVYEVPDGTACYFYKEGVSEQHKKFSLFDFLYFQSGYDKIKLDPNSNGFSLPEEMERRGVITSGKPLFESTLPLINRLSLLEYITTQLHINKLERASIVTVDVGGTTNLSKGIKAAQDVEEALNNRRVSIDLSRDVLDVAKITDALGKYKVIPNFAAAGAKGSLSRLETGAENLVLDGVTALEPIKKDICNTIGFPVDYLISGGTNRIDTLKKETKYIRLLKRHQYSLANTLERLALSHLVYKHGYAKLQNSTHCKIRVIFNDNLIGLDKIERFEHDREIIQATMNFMEGVTGVTDFSYRTGTGEKDVVYPNFGLFEPDFIRDFVQAQFDSLSTFNVYRQDQNHKRKSSINQDRAGLLKITEEKINDGIFSGHVAIDYPMHPQKLYKIAEGIDQAEAAKIV